MPAIADHPLVSSRIGNLLRLFRRYGCDAAYLPRAVAVTLLCLARQPFMAYENRRYRERIEKTPLRPDPVFLIGHWRSGTTHLQNILSRDPQFASVTVREAAMPHDFLTFGKVFARAVEKAIPEKRLMDNVAVDADAPWEEELALVASSPLSFYHVSFFPRGMERVFREAIGFDGNTSRLVEEWRREYARFLKKVASVRPGKPFLLKNPANTARIERLLELFPEARFIHIRRDPCQVFRSTVHLYLEAQKEWGFHRPTRDAIVEQVLATYPVLMRAYFAQRAAIPKGRLAEIRFEDLEKDPLPVIENAYAEAGLTGFNAARPLFENYLHSIRDYRKNPHTLSETETRRVRECWAEWFHRLDYRT